MNAVIIDGRPRAVAATWNELAKKQLLLLMPVLYGRYTDAHRQRIDALCVLLGLNLALALRLTPVQWLELYWLGDFLLGEQVGLTSNPLPWVRRRWYQRKLYGPADGLDNLRFLEFVFADSFFVAYAQSQDVKFLHQLLAVLYRPQRARYRPTAPDYGGDRRQDFNENLLDQRVPALSALPEAVQRAILTWYRGCRHALELTYPNVFTPDHEQQARSNTGGWGHVLREMSGQAFGSFEETGRQHLHTVLAKMEDDSKRAQELKRQAEAQKTTY